LPEAAKRHEEKDPADRQQGRELRQYGGLSARATEQDGLCEDDKMGVRRGEHDILDNLRARSPLALSHLTASEATAQHQEQTELRHGAGGSGEEDAHGVAKIVVSSGREDRRNLARHERRDHEPHRRRDNDVEEGGCRERYEAASEGNAEGEHGEGRQQERMRR
jgi:hypothetical protein